MSSYVSEYFAIASVAVLLPQFNFFISQNSYKVSAASALSRSLRFLFLYQADFAVHRAGLACISAESTPAIPSSGSFLFVAPLHWIRNSDRQLHSGRSATMPRYGI